MNSEQQLFPQFDFSDLRSDLFSRARRLIWAFNRDHPWLKLTDEDLLKIAGFYQENRDTGKCCLTLAAILMFGSDEAIQSVAPVYRFDCLLRRNNVDRYDDRVMISTNLIEAYDQMMAFVEKHLNEPFYLEGDMRVSLRSKIFREAVSNIISHREYIHGSPGRLIVYRDNVIFDNPCTPHYSGRITPQNLVPYARNPVICHFMIQLGRFEQLGSGVTNIYKYLPLYADGAIPVFEEIRDCFRLTLPLKNDIIKTVGAASISARNTSVEILNLLLKNPEMTAKELAEQIGVTCRTVEKNLKKLQLRGQLKRIGPKKSGHWEVVCVFYG